MNEMWVNDSEISTRSNNEALVNIGDDNPIGYGIADIYTSYYNSGASTQL